MPSCLRHGMKLYGPSVFIRCETELRNNVQILEIWGKLFPVEGLLTQSDQTHVFNMISSKYLHIMHNQCRKAIRDQLNYEKKLAHRAKHKGVSNKDLSYDYIIKCEDPEVCHRNLQDELAKPNSQFLQKLTVPQLITVGFGYNLNLKKRQGKRNIIELLKQAILTSISLLNTSFSCSGGAQKRPTPNKPKPIAKKRKTNELYPCPICTKPYNEERNSILCESCDGWHHQDCAGIADNQWEILSNSEDPWKCQKCLTVCYHINYAILTLVHNDTYGVN